MARPRGSARAAVNRISTHKWDSQVEKRLVELAELPEYKRRTQKIFDQLNSEFQYSVDENNNPLVPSLRLVTGRLATVWKNQTAKKRARQQIAMAGLMANEDHEDEEQDQEEGEQDDEVDESDNEDTEVRHHHRCCCVTL